MIKSIKHILILAVLSPLVLAGCDDLFDKGHTERAYDGPDRIGLFPETAESEEGSSVEIEVQYISSQGLANSDVNANIVVDNEATTAEEAHYELSTTSVTIPSGSATTSFTVNFPADSGLDEGDEVILVLNLEGETVEAGDNINTTTIFIQGVTEG